MVVETEELSKVQPQLTFVDSEWPGMAKWSKIGSYHN